MLETDSAVAPSRLVVPLVAAVSQTDRPFYMRQFGYKTRALGLHGFCSVKAGAASFDAVLCPDNSVVKAGALTVHSTPEQLALALSRYLIGGTYLEKAAATGLTFSAAHVVSANCFGIITVQITDTGTVSTKVPVATPTTAMTYASANEALAAVAAADSGKLKIAHILIDAKTGSAWTANTDDMTAASDLDAITITMVAAVARLTTAATNFTAMKTVDATLSATVTARKGKINDYLILLYTTDGSGALTNGVVTCSIRPRPLGGESD